MDLSEVADRNSVVSLARYVHNVRCALAFGRDRVFVQHENPEAVALLLLASWPALRCRIGEDRTLIVSRWPA